MRRPKFPVELVSTLLFAAGCASAGPPQHEAAQERILAVDAGGKVMRQSTDDEHSSMIIAAPKDKVWGALVNAYAEAGIEPTLSDPAAGRYGNTAFAVPRRVVNLPIAQVFYCGEGAAGKYVDNGRVTALIVTTLASLPNGTTSASVQVKGALRRTDSATGTLLNCSSTGAIEEFLSTSMRKRLGVGS